MKVLVSVSARSEQQQRRGPDGNMYTANEMEAQFPELLERLQPTSKEQKVRKQIETLNKQLEELGKERNQACLAKLKARLKKQGVSAKTVDEYWTRNIRA